MVARSAIIPTIFNFVVLYTNLLSDFLMCSNKANFDTHADSKSLQIKYHNYEKGQLERSEGELKAAFDGNHGWFWRNRTSVPMAVTLEVVGNYTDMLQF